MRALDHALMINTPDVTGVILAGGRARRMGGLNKGLVQFNGCALVEYCAKHLRPQVQSLLVVANEAHDEYRKWAEEVYTDADNTWGLMPGDGGPLLGLWTALQHTRSPWLAVMPCDSLGCTKPWVADLMQAARQTHRLAAFLVTPEQSEFLHCVIRRELLPELESHIKQKQLSVNGLWRKVEALPFAWSEKLLNLNTQEELRAEQRKIAANVK